MIRFFKLFGNQYLGFWILGLLFFAVQEIPYMIMPFLKLQTNPIMNMKESSVILDFFEKLLGSLCIAFMTFIVHKNSEWFSLSGNQEKIFFSLAALVLLLNFAGWILYFTGHQSVFIMMFFLVAMPPLYYVFIGLWRNNMILTITGGIFLIVHFCHVFGNLKLEDRFRL